jgi:tetraacyldisaccharide 4'-kinase
LLTASDFHAVVSGRRRDPLARLMRGVLRVGEIPYSLAVRLRNRGYDRNPARITRVEVPVISVGNLTLGGTGKTPLVAYLAHWFAERGQRVTLLSRGYGATSAEPNDEARELASQLPDVPHLQNPDRIASARRALSEHKPDVILLDDGFQHRRLGRDLDIVLLDASDPFGLNHVFPRGLLREPISGLRRAQVVALSRADLLEPPQREAIRRQVGQLAPLAHWIEVRHAPRDLLNHDGTRQEIASLEDQPVAAFCGLGNPGAFRRTLEAAGYRIAGFREFPDHYDYRPDDLQQLGDWAGQLHAAALVCSHKDLVKLESYDAPAVPLLALTIGIEFLSGQQAFHQQLQQVIDAANDSSEPATA